MIYHRSALLLFIKFHLCIFCFVGAFFGSVCSPGEKVEGKISGVPSRNYLFANSKTC